MTERRSPVARRSHPLLGAFPLAVMTLATFMVLFTLMMARLTAGKDPALQGRGTAATLVAGARTTTLTTRASGAVAGTGVRQASAQGASTTAPAIITRTSGVGGAARVGDE
jgi:hypothetical protein